LDDKDLISVSVWPIKWRVLVLSVTHPILIYCYPSRTTDHQELIMLGRLIMIVVQRVNAF